MALKPESFNQGKSQAFWALLLGIILAGFFAEGLVKGWKDPSNLRLSQSRFAVQVMTNEDLNYQLRRPGLPWVPFETTNFVKGSTGGLMRRMPEIFFLMIPEKLGTAMSVSSKDLAQIGKAQTQASAESFQIVKELPCKVNGLNGILVEFEAKILSRNIFYDRWFCVTNGFAYQLMAYGAATDRERISKEAQSLFTNFTLIDPNRIAASGNRFTNDFRSVRYGYTVEIAGSPWQMFTGLSNSVPEAEFGASQGGSCFVVIPVWLGGQDVDSEALAAGLLATFHVSYPDEKLSSRKELKEGGFHGLQ